MTRPRSRTPSLAFVGILLALLLVGRARMLHDPGAFWHVAVGHDIFRTHALPTTDRFTFTHVGEPWIAQQWLAECAMAALDRIGGLDALLLVSAALLAAAYASAFARLVAAGVLWPLAALILGMTIAASSYHFLVRPHLITLAFSGWLYALLCDFDAGRLSSRRLLLLPIAFVLWTNMHGGAMGGLATLMLAGAIWLMQAPIPLLSGERAGRHEISISTSDALARPGCGKLSLAILLICFLAPLANPYGLALPRVWLGLMRSSVLPQLIQEHAPPRWNSPEFWSLTALVVLYATGLLGTDLRRFRLIWLMPLAWAVLAYSRVRHGPIFAIMVPIALAEMLPGSRWAAWFEARHSDLLTSPATPRRASAILPIALPVIALCLTLQATGCKVPLIGAGWAQLDSVWWPTAATPALRAALSERPNQPNVFNEMLFGGYLVRYVPDARIYIDDRCELLGDDGLLAYMNAQRDCSMLLDELSRDDVRLALVQTGSAFDAAFAAAGWHTRHRDPTATLYELTSAGLSRGSH